MPVRMAREIGIELMRALCVLALIFLSFAHAPLATPAAGPDTLTATVDASYCGDQPDDSKAHAPCHACRIGGGADLQPRCGLMLSAALVADVAYGAMPALSLPAQAQAAYAARAPPLA